MMTSTVPPTPCEQKSNNRCAVTVTSQKNNGDLLDFSFLNIESITELEESQCIEPRTPFGKKKPQKVEVEVTNEEGEVETVEKYNSFGLRLTSNELTDAGIEPLLKVLDNVIIDPMAITWIDLSSNQLTKIKGDVFCNLQLKILYLHDNNITDLNEVDKLGNMQQLNKLTLHCNPIAHKYKAFYRSYVLSKVPQLRCFDFSTITKADRSTATCWNRGNNAQKKQGHHGNNDD